MKTFKLYRIVDDSGVSGCGVVAQGVQFDNGKCALSWCSKTNINSVTVYDSISDLDKIHSHGNHTRVVWDEETDD
jgi:hypothetical protein